MVVIAGNYLITEQGNPEGGDWITGGSQDLLLLTSLDLHRLVIITSISITLTITKFNTACLIVSQVFASKTVQQDFLGLIAYSEKV